MRADIYTKFMWKAQFLLVFLISLSFLSLSFGVDNPTLTPRAKTFIDVSLDGADSRLLKGITRGLSVASQPKCDPLSRMDFTVNKSTC